MANIFAKGGRKKAAQQHSLASLEARRDRILRTFQREELDSLRHDCFVQEVSLEGLFRGRISVPVGRDVDDVLEEKIVAQEKADAHIMAISAAAKIHGFRGNDYDSLLPEFDKLTEVLIVMNGNTCYDSAPYGIPIRHLENLLLTSGQRVCKNVQNIRSLARLQWALRILERSANRPRAAAIVRPLLQILLPFEKPRPQSK